MACGVVKVNEVHTVQAKIVEQVIDVFLVYKPVQRISFHLSHLVIQSGDKNVRIINTFVFHTVHDTDYEALFLIGFSRVADPDLFHGLLRSLSLEPIFPPHGGSIKIGQLCVKSENSDRPTGTLLRMFH